MTHSKGEKKSVIKYKYTDNKDVGIIKQEFLNSYNMLKNP